MKVYCYNLNGEYVGEDFAHPDPLQPARWVMPANTTTVEPPKVGEGLHPVWNGEAWEIKEFVKDKSHKATLARLRRNALLANSDFTQIADAPAWVNKPAWATYRQSLRDIPQQAGFPNDIVWPTPPERE